MAPIQAELQEGGLAPGLELGDHGEADGQLVELVVADQVGGDDERRLLGDSDGNDDIRQLWRKAGTQVCRATENE